MTVVVISTGGTIASTDEAGDGASPSLSGADLVASVPGLNEVTDVILDDFANIPSPHFTIGQMHELSEHIATYDSDPDISGIVVTHGTDILEETAYFVDRTYDGATPVVFTGAMRNPSVASPDGPANLLTAVLTAADEGSSGLGVLVAFNDRIHASRHVTKVHSMNLDTFQSPEFGPLATRDEGRIQWHTTVERTRAVEIRPARLTNDVAAVFVTADMHPGRIPRSSECRAVVLAATGAGHIPPGIIDPLEQLAEADVPLVATTRCPAGRLARRTYDFYGSEATLRDMGCYYSKRNLQKARIDTIVGIAGDCLPLLLDRP